MTREQARAALVLVLAATAAVLCMAPGRGYWIVDPDAAAYVGLAQSLARGDGFAFQGVPHAKFPPGFPAWLALAIRVSGDPQNWAALRDAVSIAGVGCVWLTYLVGRRVLRTSREHALVLATLTASSVFFVQYAVAFLRSEPLFTALFLAAMVLGEDFRRRGGVRRAAACGVFAGLATMTRTAGITVLPALLLSRLLEARGRVPLATLARELVICTIATLALPGAFAVRNAGLDGAKSSSYADELFAQYALDLTKDVDVTMPSIDAAGMVERVRRNLAVFVESSGKFLVNNSKGGQLAVRTTPDGPRLHAGGYALLALLVLGASLWWLRGATLAALALAAYVALYLIWPFDQQQRFYMPIQVLILGALATAIAPLANLGLGLLDRRGFRIALSALFAVAAFGLGRKHSVEPTVLSRWSTEYALLVLGCAGLALVAAAAAAVPPSLWSRFQLRERAPRLVPRGVAIGSIALLALFIVSSLIPEHQRFLAERELRPVPREYATFKTHPKLIELVDWLKHDTEPGGLVMSDIPKMIHMMTGLRTTPLRVSSAERRMVLDTPDGRPTYVYYSREIPQITEIVDAWAPSHLETVMTIPFEEGAATVEIELFRVPPEAPR
ncbi:MAG: glycosyltransferase family 39 protein [Planctomycetes bacterium]|nr:glycosyltransferase family 39 protein [Planctomycetota bacterium]MCC7168974.1 glycosyltransferase family 39 protein [Planctomycetota bacterium]